MRGGVNAQFSVLIQSGQLQVEPSAPVSKRRATSPSTSGLTPSIRQECIPPPTTRPEDAGRSNAFTRDWITTNIAENQLRAHQRTEPLASRR